MSPEQAILGIALIAMLGLVGLMKVGVPAFGFAKRLALRAFMPLVVWYQKKRKLQGVWIGYDFLNDDSRLRHTHIVGSTGTGKTVLLESLICSDIRRGLGALIIDPKGDRELYDRVRGCAAEVGREDDILLLSAQRPDESVCWNPCGFGDESMLQSKFYNSAIYAEPHYAKAVELGLLRIFSELCKGATSHLSLGHVVAELDLLRKKSKDKVMEGLYLDLQSLYESEWKAVLEQSKCQKPEIQLLDVIQQKKILFVDLPTESKAVQSKRVGRLLLQEIVNASGLFKSYSGEIPAQPFPVYVDEFDAFATESFAMFLNKGRSSKFMIHMAHQTLSDLRQVSETFSGRIMGNVNARFIFRQDDPDDAETWSRLFGTEIVEIGTYRVTNGDRTGDASMREGREFRVSPDLIKSLPVGRCIYSVKSTNTLKELRVPFEKLRYNQQPKLSLNESGRKRFMRSSIPVNLDHINHPTHHLTATFDGVASISIHKKES